MPGSSATRPQFIKVKPGESIEAAVARKKGIDTSSDKNDEVNVGSQGRPRKLSSRFDFFFQYWNFYQFFYFLISFRIFGNFVNIEITNF